MDLRKQGKKVKKNAAKALEKTKKLVSAKMKTVPTWAKNALRAAAVIVALYLILMPILPKLDLYIKGLRGELVYERSDDFMGDPQSGDSGNRDGSDDAIPDKNTLVIPVIGVNVKIVEGSDDSALDYGAWHRPGTGTPESGGNMVITGHRFKYLPPNNLTFYHLPSVQLGDDVIVYWKGEKYEYVITDTMVVDPDQIEVEAQTVSPRITLYTCTPLWTAAQRFVAVAEPLETSVETDGGIVELQPIEE